MDVADMTGKTVVVTGGSSGIGLETAVALARAGADTVITARDRGRGEAALADVRRRSGHDRVDLLVFDLGRLASVREGRPPSSTVVPGSTSSSTTPGWS